MKLLIVDDEASICSLLKDYFEMESIDVHESRNGQEAFRMAQKYQFDCVLSDVRMAGGDGIELAQNIYLMKGPKPIVMLMTGYSDITIETVKHYGVQEIFEKPFDPEIVAVRIIHAINESKRYLKTECGNND